MDACAWFGFIQQTTLSTYDVPSTSLSWEYKGEEGTVSDSGCSPVPWHHLGDRHAHSQALPRTYWIKFCIFNKIARCFWGILKFEEQWASGLLAGTEKLLLSLKSSIVSTEKEFPQNLSQQTIIWAVKIAIRETQTQAETWLLFQGRQQRGRLVKAKGQEYSSYLGSLCKTEIESRLTGGDLGRSVS